MKELTQEQALSVLVSAAKVAQSKGAFTLDDAVLVKKAIDIFAVNPENGQSEIEGSVDTAKVDTEGAPDENPA